MRRINLIDQAYNQSEDSTEDDAENMILQVGGKASPPFVLKGKINNVAFTTMIYSGSPITKFTQSDLKKILKTDVIFARPFPKGEEYVDYSGRPLNLLGFTTVDVKVGKKKIKKARVVITRDGKKSLIGRDWLISLNFTVADTNNKSEYNNSINNISSNKTKIEKIELSPELKRIKQKFPEISSRQGKIVGHTIPIEIKEGAKATQQKGRRALLLLRKAVDAEIKNLINSGHIERVDKISDEVFIQPVVITVRKDRSVKIALDARSLNIAIMKEKYQMPNLDSLMEKLSKIVNGKQKGEVLFTSLDMLYAYGQTTLHPDTAKHCNFQIIGGATTGTYAFKTGFYGPTIMPPEFQKIMDKIVRKKTKTFAFIGDILTVTKGSKADHLEDVDAQS